ncbi:primosomal protein [Pedococcus cremeus]|nr:primosomal protein [Pedococcus cremeus]
MTSDPRAALVTLTSALERHLEASASKRGEDDPAVVAAYEDLADAFEAYDDALLEAYGEMTPLTVYEEDEIDDHYEDEDGDEGLYSGLDDEEYDTDEDSDEGPDEDSEDSEDDLEDGDDIAEADGDRSRR